MRHFRICNTSSLHWLGSVVLASELADVSLGADVGLKIVAVVQRCSTIVAVVKGSINSLWLLKWSSLFILWNQFIIRRLVANDVRLVLFAYGWYVCGLSSLLVEMLIHWRLTLYCVDHHRIHVLGDAVNTLMSAIILISEVWILNIRLLLFFQALKLIICFSIFHDGVLTKDTSGLNLSLRLLWCLRFDQSIVYDLFNFTHKLLSQFVLILFCECAHVIVWGFLLKQLKSLLFDGMRIIKSPDVLQILSQFISLSLSKFKRSLRFLLMKRVFIFGYKFHLLIKVLSWITH